MTQQIDKTGAKQKGCDLLSVLGFPIFDTTPQGTAEYLQPEIFDTLFHDETASALKDRLFNMFALAIANPDYTAFFDETTVAENAYTMLNLFEFLTKMEKLYEYLAHVEEI